MSNNTDSTAAAQSTNNRTHHCHECKASVSTTCIEIKHIAKCDGSGADHFFQTKFGCKAHPYSKGYNLDLKPVAAPDAERHKLLCLRIFGL